MEERGHKKNGDTELMFSINSYDKVLKKLC